MVRVQIQLPDEQARRLHRVAEAQGVSMAEVVRRCIDRGLNAEALDDRWRRALGIGGAFRDPKGAVDVAARHYEFLDRAHTRSRP